MSEQDRWHVTIRRQTMTLAGVLALLSVSAVGTLYWLEHEANARLKVAAEYHLESSLLSRAAIGEIDEIFISAHQTHEGAAGPSDQRALAAAFDRSTRLNLVLQHMSEIQRLHARYRRPEFDDLTGRLVALTAPLRAATRGGGAVGEGPAQDALLSTLRSLKTAFQQIGRLHGISYDDLMTELEARSTRQIYLSITFVLAIAAIGTFVCMRVLTSIGSVLNRQREIENELNRALIGAEEANQAKTDFLATMSHEFRTPLNAILGFAEMMHLRMHGALGARQYGKYVEYILESGMLLRSHVNDILNIAVLQAGQESLLFEPIDAAGIVGDAVNILEPQARERGVTLSAECGPDTLVFEGDRRSVTQIVLNLLSNAIRFTDGGGQVRVSARREAGDIVIAVADTGVGISEDQIARVTEPFFRAHSDPLLTRDGKGLGLSIVRSLVEAHRGRLEIESELGKGTTVSVMLPVRRPPA